MNIVGASLSIETSVQCDLICPARRSKTIMWTATVKLAGEANINKLLPG